MGTGSLFLPLFNCLCMLLITLIYHIEFPRMLHNLQNKARQKKGKKQKASYRFEDVVVLTFFWHTLHTCAHTQTHTGSHTSLTRNSQGWVLLHTHFLLSSDLLLVLEEKKLQIKRGLYLPLDHPSIDINTHTHTFSHRHMHHTGQQPGTQQRILSTKMRSDFVCVSVCVCMPQITDFTCQALLLSLSYTSLS